jgi:hypothetical protein
MIALIVCTLLGTAYLLSGTKTSAVAQRSTDRLQARMLAETALSIGTRYMTTDVKWRANRPNGVWISNYSLNGGSFTLSGQDGETIGADGTVQGDGSLADSENDPVTLTAVGSYGRAKYRMRSIVRVAGIPNIVAADKIELKADSVVDSYSSLGGVYGGNNAGNAGRIASNANGKENIVLQNTARITGTMYFPPAGDPTQALLVAKTATITGGTGAMLTDGVPIDPIVLPTYTPVTTDTTYNSTSVTTLSADTAFNNLTIQDNAVLNISGNVKLFVDGDFQVLNNSRIVLANPQFGNSSPFNKTQAAVASQQIATPVTVTSKIAVRTIAAYVLKFGMHIRMAIYSDGGGKPGTLLCQTATENMTSDSFYWHESYLPETVLNPGTYWLSLAFDDPTAAYCYSTGAGSTAIRANNAVANGFLNSWGTSNSSPAYPVNIYITGNIAGQGATLEIYTAGKCVIRDSANVNRNTGQCDRLKIYNYNPDITAQTELATDSVTYATIHSPDVPLWIHDRAVLYGKAHVESLKAEADSVIQVDNTDGLALPGLLLDEGMLMKDRAVVTGMTGAAIVGSNSVGTPVIWLRDRSILNGDAYGGPGGAGGNVGYKVANKDVKKDVAASMTGDTHNLKEAIDLSVPATPTNLTINKNNVKYMSGIRVISSSYQCKDLTFDKTVAVEIDGDIVIIVTGNLKFLSDAQITLRPNARLTLYCLGKTVTIQDRVKVNIGGDPTKFLLYYPGTSRIEMRNSAAFCATIRAPLAEVKVKDTANFYGWCYAFRFTTDNHGKVHCDSANSSRAEWIEGR